MNPVFDPLPRKPHLPPAGAVWCSDPWPEKARAHLFPALEIVVSKGDLERRQEPVIPATFTGPTANVQYQSAEKGSILSINTSSIPVSIFRFCDALLFLCYLLYTAVYPDKIAWPTLLFLYYLLYTAVYPDKIAWPTLLFLYYLLYTAVYPDKIAWPTSLFLYYYSSKLFPQTKQPNPHCCFSATLHNYFPRRNSLTHTVVSVLLCKAIYPHKPNPASSRPLARSWFPHLQLYRKYTSVKRATVKSSFWYSVVENNWLFTQLFYSLQNVKNLFPSFLTQSILWKCYLISVLGMLLF